MLTQSKPSDLGSHVPFDADRASSGQKWEEGDVLSLDSGGNYHGYIGDVARMATLGEPDAEFGELLGEIEEVQQTAFKSVKAGAMGGGIYAAAEPLVRSTITCIFLPMAWASSATKRPGSPTAARCRMRTMMPIDRLRQAW